MQDDFQEFFLHVLLQLIVIIAAARTGGWFCSKIGQPQVVGEIVAGLLLGPSVLGQLSPELVAYLFPTETSLPLRVISELGLVLLMFLIGLEFDFSHLRQVGKTATGIAVAGIVLPLILGASVAGWMHPHIAADVDRLGFVLIVAVALSITAIPILGRIMVELNIQRTPLGALTITAAAIDDAVGWILLAAVGALIHGGFDPWIVARMLLWTILFVVGCTYLFGPWIARGAAYILRRSGGELSTAGLSLVLILVFSAAAVTNAIGVFAIFGPFVLGASLSNQIQLRDAISGRLRDVVYALFLPIFFTYSGLRTNVGLLENAFEWGLCLLVLAAAMTGKLVGCGAAARLGGLSWSECCSVALMMNTRALMGLIAINVGRELGVVPDKVYSMLVIMAVTTTLLTTPLLRRILKTEKLSRSVSRDKARDSV